MSDKEFVPPLCGMCKEDEMKNAPFADVFFCPSCGYMISGERLRATESLKDGGEEDGA